MKKAFSLLLAMALLAGCGAPAEPEALPDKPPVSEETVSLPESRRLEPISAPAIVTEGREPAEGYELPPLPQDTDWRTYRNNAERWVTDGPSIAVLAEDREVDAILYGLPLYANSSGETALIRWGDSLAEFDWALFPGPSMVLPQIKGLDGGLGVDKLAVICQVGTGTGVSIQELHILEKGPDGTLMAYTFPERLWQEELPRPSRCPAGSGRTRPGTGGRPSPLSRSPRSCRRRFSPNPAPGPHDGTPPAHNPAWRRSCRQARRRGTACYVAETSAEVLYRDGVFTMQDFHLYSYDQ